MINDLSMVCKKHHTMTHVSHVYLLIHVVTSLIVLYEN